jgi:hypothetical protein
MRSIRARLERLEKPKDGPRFTFWDLLAGFTPPAGWKLPEDLAKALAELPDPVPKVIEEKIYKDG